MEGTLTDAGPLIALLNRSDNHHNRAVSAIDRIVSPLITTWPSIAEAMFLLGDAAGWKGQNALWEMIEAGEVVIAVVPETVYPRIRTLMAKYRDLPMDLADATLVAYAEINHSRRIFSLDHHFHIYRLNDRHHFDVIG